ncbi:MAG TPA: hypothetical protein VFF69_01370 [Phycisphaerales bacterium]|nr:hypothetical protein [Phycisphaerales bacterium]
MPTTQTPCATGRPWRARPFPGDLAAPTMLTREEVDYLHWLGAEWCAGVGRVCDLGCFLGGSTIPLAQGLASNPRSRAGLLAYDSFVMHPGSARTFPVGVGAGESFRPVFDSYTAPWRAGITVREGLLPDGVPEDGGRAIYPEQEPIELLFNDCSKRWGVHKCVLWAFGRHLIPGRSMLVQQDFKSYGEFWIPLHMFALRDCFELGHEVPSSASVSFTYVGGLTEERVRALPVSLAPDAVAPAWDAVQDWWESRAGPATCYVLTLCRAYHLACSHEWAQSERALAGAACGLDPAELGEEAEWARAEWRRTLAGCRRLAREHGAGEAFGALEGTTLPGADRHAAAETSRLRAALWARVAEVCAARGWKDVALYGAGRHTAEMLRSGWPGNGLRVAAVIDDYSLAPEIEGVRVCRPAGAGPIDGVVVSSAAGEEMLARAAEKSLRGVPIVRIYGAPAS